jgi:hypothetical protein
VNLQQSNERYSEADPIHHVSERIPRASLPLQATLFTVKRARSGIAKASFSYACCATAESFANLAETLIKKLCDRNE